MTLVSSSDSLARERVEPRKGRVHAGLGGLDLRSEFALPSERRRVHDWLDQGLRPGRPGRLLAEYPTILAADSKAIPITAFLENEPVAHATLVPRVAQLRVREKTLRFDVGLISLVYTDPRFRGQGFARHVLQQTLETASAKRLALTLLWSDLDSLYEPLGFLQVGSETVFALSSARLQCALESAPVDSPRGDLRIEPMEPLDWDRIFSLRAQRTAGLVLDKKEFEGMRDLPDMRVRVARSDAGGVEAFAAVGRGDDFPGVIHEWGGTTRGVLACCLELASEWQSKDQPIFLLSPDDSNPVAETLRQADTPTQTQPLAWVKVTDRDRMRCVAGSAGAVSLPASVRADSGEAEADWLRAVFGLPQDADARRSGDRMAPMHSFFVWGLESF